MLGTFISVLKAEREAKQRAVEQMDAGRPSGVDPVKSRFRQQIAELDRIVERLEARRR